jgi:molecular chaperone GrpE
VLEGEVVETSAEAENAVPTAENTAASAENVVSLEEFDQLAQKLQERETQAKDYFDGWQRERADFANYKRRIERDQQMIQQNITMNVLKKYLAVQDDWSAHEPPLKAVMERGRTASTHPSQASDLMPRR